MLRDWQTVAVVLAACAFWSYLWYSSGYSAGYQAGTQTVVDQYQPRAWALCSTGWRWERCAKLEDGGLVLFRGLR